MKKLLCLLICFILIGLTSCKNNNNQTLTLTDTPKQTQECADELIEYLKPDTYAWGYTIMQGEMNLTVDFICKIDFFYAKDRYTYCAEYICYIIDDDVDFEEISHERVW